ncbi:hypothetical protein CEXT_118891 [Caerostris extrusa]|uniref:Uncharacterized protein n=1 Tax=Caerostris extrusa TaxID=172846 RepID=A0AAV4Y215_CAEEX|nr:hypothetical protein CEXT_118891 [Caerostris extrusa]
MDMQSKMTVFRTVYEPDSSLCMSYISLYLPPNSKKRSQFRVLYYYCPATVGAIRDFLIDTSWLPAQLLLPFRGKSSLTSGQLLPKKKRLTDTKIRLENIRRFSCVNELEKTKSYVAWFLGWKQTLWKGSVKLFCMKWIWAECISDCSREFIESFGIGCDKHLVLEVLWKHNKVSPKTVAVFFMTFNVLVTNNHVYNSLAKLFLLRVILR